MYDFIKKYILGNSNRNVNAPYLFIMMVIFLVATTIYYAIVSNINYLLIRLTISILMVLFFILLERSKLSTTTLAFVMPFQLIGLLTLGTLVFYGDFLIYVYTVGGAMISLTYMRPKGMLLYIIFTTLLQSFVIFILGANILNPNLNFSQNVAGLVAATILNIAIYRFSLSYTRVFKAKEEFLSRMSHEIRTPITTVLGISEIEIKKNIKNQTIHETNSFLRINRAANTLLDIVNDVLDFSKLKDGKVDMIIKEYKVAELLQDVSQMYQTIAIDKNLVFTIDISDNTPSCVIGDKRRIMQVVVNVLSNAFKYTQAGHVALKVSAAQINEQKSMLVFEISDTGLGMTKKQIGNIFDAYARFHEYEQATEIGTGLGMPIVQELMLLLGGNIKIDSSPFVGTVVQLKIPHEINKKDVLNPNIIQALKEFKLITDKKAINAYDQNIILYAKVLIVDDTEANLYVVKGLLAFYKLEIETCVSGFEAIDKIKKGNVYDIIFMDAMMPGISGTESMHAIRGLNYKGPIVVLTANAFVGMKEKYLEEGFDDFLSKPIQTDVLHKILIKHIKSNARSHNIRQLDIKKDNDQEKNLRIRFKKEYKNIFVHVSEALDQNDYQRAHIAVHSLKSVAALIKAVDLEKNAQIIEDLLADKKMPSPIMLTKLNKSLIIVLENIQEPKRPEGFYEKNSLAIETLLKLKPLLAQGDLESVEICKSLKGFKETDIIVHQIENFEFLNALTNVEILLKLWDVPSS